VGLSIDERLFEGFRGIGPLLRENAVKSDRDGRLPASSLEALRDAGLLRPEAPVEVAL
jgi:hypothetical protein